MAQLKIIILAVFLLFLPTMNFAYIVTRTFTSTPITNSGFSYTDSFGNTFSYGVTQNVPIIIHQTQPPNGIWVMMYNAHVPDNALVMQYINGRPIFYCRVNTNNNFFYYGSLIPNEGCYIPDLSDSPITTYQVLLR